MMFQTLTATAMLFWGSFVSPVQDLSNEQVLAPAPIEIVLPATQSMTAETEEALIEDYAAPHWNLSVEDAWAKYYNHEIVLEEIVPNVEYKIHYSGHLLAVLDENL